MRLVAKRKGVAVIIATLIMLAAAALFSSIMLFWGLSFQGQSLTNYGNAIARSNNAGSEQISIDTVLFRMPSPSPPAATALYTATVYARNFGDQPVRIAGVHIGNLQSGSSPPGFDCEVNTGATAGHLTIVARSSGAIPLDSGCKTGITFPVCYDGATLSIEITTEGGSNFHNNYVVPTAGVSIMSHSDSPSATTPSFTVTIGNTGCLGQTISSIAINGAASNGANDFTGSLTTGIIPSSGTFSLTVSDGIWTVSPNTGSTYQSTSFTSGGSISVVLSSSAAGATTKLVAGDSYTVTITTSTGVVISTQYTA